MFKNPLARLLLTLTLVGVGMLAPLEIEVRAAFTVTEKLTEGITTNGTSYTSSGTFTLATDSLGICVVVNTDATPAEALSTFTQTGQSWTEIASTTGSTVAAPVIRMTVLRDTGAGAAAAAVTGDVGGADNQSGMAFNCFEITGADMSGGDAGAVIQSKTGTEDGITTGTTFNTVTLDSGRTTNSLLFFTAAQPAARTWTEDSGYSKGTETVYATPTTEMLSEWITSGTSINPLFTLADGTSDATGIAVEIKLAGGGAPTFYGRFMTLGAGE